MPNAFHTVVVPAAGTGTRMLPATKAVPKELLPILDTPAIELTAAEAAAAGAERMIIVSAPGKDMIARHFQPNAVLEQRLEDKGKSELLAAVRHAESLLRVEIATQQEPLGLGHAIACAEPYFTDRDEAVAVMLPDDLILPAGILPRMAAVRQQYGGTVLCAFEAPREALSAYGVYDLVDTADPHVKRVRHMVEKPDPQDAPSTFASAGRYLLDRAVFEPLKHVKPGARGEIDLTDALVELIRQGHPVHVVVHTGKRHDIGNPAGMLQAAVDFALDDPTRGPDLRSWLETRLPVGAGSR
ncbi:UTP--glucose-1-phosphate uridylyltransferase [Kitasatospora mediocidica]|uniref:UTP--glucose-1-phosphate uridylyltransferase n=1 Tax=Kitasatospora mediocidica TaxID=58352 RepID=UPI00056D1AF7|nr:UTP--glucose-1-phosphate uridylyltransferase [Kitasatospora mediocidica]